MINHLWQSTVIAVAAALIARSPVAHRASVRHGIWLAASVKFLVPLTIFSSLGAWLGRSGVVPDIGGSAAVATLATLASPSRGDGAAVSTLVLIIWICGAAGVLLSWLRHSHHFAAMVARGRPMSEGYVAEALRRLEPSTARAREIRVVSTDAALEPMVAGVFRPVLIWPEALNERLSEREIDAVLAHELAHIRRHDNATSALHAVVTAVCWFHPLVWWIGARLLEERERACDELVLDQGARPATYAASILRTCEVCLTGPIQCASGVTGGNLTDRISRIMNYQAGEAPGAGRRSLLAAFVAVVVVLPVVWGACTARVVTPSADMSAQDKRPRIVMPRLKKEVKPSYSARALHEKIEGEVLMSCIVRPNGRPTDIKIVKPLDPDLNQAAVRALEQWEFFPGTRNDKPVPVEVTITVLFSLRR